MLSRRVHRTAALAVALALAPALAEAGIVLEGRFLKVQISDLGTIGPGLGDGFGLQVDPRGNGRHSIDMLNGLRHEGFAIVSDQTGMVENANGIADLGAGTLAALREGARWTGSFVQFFSVSHTFLFDPDTTEIVIETTITALQDLTGVAFGRAIDPSPDASLEPGLDFETTNSRGGAGASAARRVFGRGPLTGLGLELLNLTDGRESNTGLFDCCTTESPLVVLGGAGAISPLVEFADQSLQMAWLIGDLAEGESATIRYAYRVDVPEPASFALFAFWLAALGLVRRRM